MTARMMMIIDKGFYFGVLFFKREFFTFKINLFCFVVIKPNVQRCYSSLCSYSFEFDFEG